MKTARYAAALAVLSLAACNGDAPPEAGAETEAADAAAQDTPATVDGTEDALVPGTEYNATTIMKCGFDNAAPTQDCDAGIVRNWGEEGKHLIEVSKPDGTTRALFFDGTTPTGADSAEADGSAGWDFDWSRSGDEVIVRFGPESYVVVDAMITGG